MFSAAESQLVVNSMASNCSDIIPSLRKYYLSPMYAMEFAIGFIGNLVVVLGYIFCLPSWKSTNVYLFSLALSDLIFLCTLPQLSYTYAHDQHIYVTLCVTNRYILHVNLYSSILFMVWVSVDRLLLLRHPQRDHFLLTCKGSLCMSLLTWIWVNIQVAPLISFVLHDLQLNGWSKCNDFGSLGQVRRNLAYSLVLTITGYLLPLLCLFLSSFKMVSLLVGQEQVFGTSYQKPMKILRVTAIMFLVIYTPIHVMRNVRIASELSELMLSQCSKVYIEAVYIVTRPIAFAHSVINPVFYFIMTDRFKYLIQDKIRQIGRMVMNQTRVRS